MKNKILKNFTTSIVLMTFVFSNALGAFAMENAASVRYDTANKPNLRAGDGEYSLQLKGDVSFVKRNNPISISLRDSDVKQVLRMFADKAGMNIICHDSVSGNVTLDLVDIPLNKAVDMVM